MADLAYRCPRDLFVDDSLALEVITVCLDGSVMWRSTQRVINMGWALRRHMTLSVLLKNVNQVKQHNRPNTTFISSFETSASEY